MLANRHLKLLYVFSVLLLLSGCVEKTEKKESQVIKLNVLNDPVSLHPYLGIDIYCRCLQKALFEGLTRLNPAGIAELAAAERVEISDDQLRYTFTLRPTVWNNGQEVKAQHFANSWKRGIEKGSNCLRADLYYIIKNAKQAKKGEVPIDEVGITVLNNKTILVELEHPSAYFLDLLSNPIFAPLYDDSESPTVFNGPFCIDFWERDKQLFLRANPLYWDKKNVRLNGIDITMVGDHYTAFLMFEKGEIDWIGNPFSNIPLDALPGLEKAGKVISQKIAGVYWLSCNTQILPLTSPKIRKALACGINRKDITEHVLQGETPIRSVQPPWLQLVEESELYPDGNIAYAQALFNEGLADLQLTKEMLPPIQFSYSDYPGQKALVQAVACEWEKIFNIKIDLVGSEWNVFFSNLGLRQFEVGGCIWYFLYNDASYPLEFFKEMSHRYNTCQWENKTYQNLLNAADYETNIEKRNGYLRDAEKILLDEMPIIPIYVVNNKYMTCKALKGVYMSDLGHIDFKWAYLDHGK